MFGVRPADIFCSALQVQCAEKFVHLRDEYCLIQALFSIPDNMMPNEFDEIAMKSVLQKKVD
jgi:hypothetical protein